jgi:hypothetical protein
LDKFSEKAIKEGMPMSSIEEALVPMYLFHRYQVEATSKLIGGMEYTYTVRGDGQTTTRLLSFDEQLAALNALLNTVKVENLKLTESLLGKIPPRAFGFSRSRETFQSKTGPAFDYLAAAETAASIPFSFLFNADRTNRLVTFNARQSDQPGLDEVLNRTISSVWMSPSSNRLDRTLQRVVEMEMLNHLMGLAVNDRAYDEVRAKAMNSIKSIRAYAKGRTQRQTNEDGVYYQYVVQQIDQFLEEPSKFKQPNVIKAPDGSPIGSCDF